uniref:Uncharacterized protein n=1 Tax=Brassica oleracea var. oleracea TaxID=109376 RepID=A0A0D3APW5_BRAOL
MSKNASIDHYDGPKRNNMIDRWVYVQKRIDRSLVRRNFLGIFRRIDVSSEFRRYIPKKFRGKFRGFHFPSECLSEYRCFIVVIYCILSLNLLTSDYFVVYFYCEVVDVASGSSIPDCSHACGPCTPCKLAVVSSKCSASESEACPVVYKCLCKGKYYHVPSIA